MHPRQKIGIHVTDAPIMLRDGDRLVGKHIVLGGSTFGRVLFTEPPIAILVVGQNVRIEHCIIEALTST